ncbi:hypothetical protein KCU65_g4898, partial [Aureobasidium melanogenum]
MTTIYPTPSKLMKDRVAKLDHTYNPDPNSIRRPGKMSFRANVADQIERALQADGHRIWGFVVYRCTYDNDEEWQFCMRHLREQARHSMKYYNGLDMLDDKYFRLTVIEDRSKLDGADYSVIRQHFREWRIEALHREQGSHEEIESRRQEPVPWYGGLAVRYRFCLFIDAASLRSIVERGHEPCINGDGPWVNLTHDDHHSEYPSDSEDDLKFIDDDDDGDGGYPSIDGNTQEDIGWMRVCPEYLLTIHYSWCWDLNYWAVNYARPPYVLCV